MSTQLDPVVIRRLQQFANRRRWLLTLRGLCSGTVTFLLCLALASFVDWYWLLTDPQRWALSVFVYLPAVIMIWMSSVRQLLRRLPREELAARMEHLEPELRERLLSAVELAVQDPAAVNDSPVFRSLLQAEVAQHMGPLQVRGLLPFQLIGRWTLAAGVMVCLAIFLMTSRDVRFRQLAVRAMLPMANVARVSRIRIQVLQPTPHSLLLAEDETVAVVVDVRGGTVDEVTLETRSESQGVVRQSMRGRSDTEFAANLHIQDPKLEYRILAGDAITARFTIESRPRPRVVSFTKTFAYPEYSLLPTETRTEPDGSLVALQGTDVELRLQPDQDIATAELRIDLLNSDDVRTIPLTQTAAAMPSKPALWTAKVPLTDAGNYQVHLVSAETGFENTFSPRYEIRPQPDLIPRAGFVDQRETSLLLPPDDLLSLRGMAEDDLPLARLDQEISINGDEWLVVPLQMVPVDGTEGRSVTATWQWDLIPHRLKQGDQVLTRIVATDRRGSRGESVPLRVIVADRVFDPDRHTQMELKLSLQPELVALATQLGEQKAAALPAIERLRDTKTEAQQVALDRSALLDLAVRQQEISEKLLTRIIEVERGMQAGSDAYELELTGRVVARLQTEYAAVPSFLLSVATLTIDEKQRQADLEELKRIFERSADDARVLSEHYSWMAAWNFLNAIAVDMDSMLRHQQLVVGSPTQTWRRLVRQETVLISQLRLLEQLTQKHRVGLPQAFEGPFEQLVDWCETSRDRLQQEMESEDRLAELQKVSRNLLEQLQQRQKSNPFDGNLPGQLQNAWRDLENRAANVAPAIDEAARAAEQENQLLTQAVEADDSARSQQLRDQAQRSASALEMKSRRSLEQLRIRRDLSQSQADPDHQYAADAGLALRALTSLLHKQRSREAEVDKVPAALLEVAPAWRTLEAGHELVIAATVLSRLHELERWGSQKLQSLSDHPRHWDLFQQTVDVAARRLGEARMDGKLIGRLNETRWSSSARDAGRRITERRWKREILVSAGNELSWIRDELDAVQNDLQPAMAAARAVLAKYAPTIPELAAQTAAEVRRLEEQTLQTADRLEKSKQEPAEQQQAQQQMRDLQQQQQQINRQLDDLLQALVEDANRQDVSDDQQQERARDADDSMAMIQPPATAMNKELQDAQAAENAADQSAELAQAAEQQERTADVLDVVAEHFRRLNEGQDVAQTRQQLRQAEQELGITEQLEQQYAQADRLQQQMQQTPEQLMQELEAELQKNPEMQQALSEISQNALQEAQRALQDAALEDQNLQKANERADTSFQQQKRELSEDLRELAADASRLSGMLVAQASQSAAQGKAPEAQQQFAAAQQKLNQAAAQANAAREELLLSELQEAATQTQQSLREATDLLKQAQQTSETAKQDAAKFPEQPAREALQKTSEQQRQRFREQQQKTASDLAKQTEDNRVRTEQQMRTVEKELEAAVQKAQKAAEQQKNAPENAGLQQALAREQNAQQQVEQKLQAARHQMDRATEKAQTAARRRDDIAKTPQTPLGDPNPAAQLAEQYAAESLQVATELGATADKLNTAADFDSQLKPPEAQLTAADQRQQEITTDVQQAADAVARAARHERRLNNPTAADPLQQTADQIQQAAANESTQAERQLELAATEARQATANASAAATPNAQPPGSPTADTPTAAGNPGSPAGQPAASPDTPAPADNAQALLAQQDLVDAEQAFEQRADQLNGILEPRAAEAAAAAAAQAEAALQSPDGSQNPAAAAAPSAEDLARGQQLARTLDELDRQMQAAQAQPGGPPQQGRTPETLAQSLTNQQSRMAAARQQAQQQARQAMNQPAQQSADGFSEPPAGTEFGVADVQRKENTKWGKLRSQSAEDVSRGQSEQISEAYRRSVESYFKVLAERARKK